MSVVVAIKDGDKVWMACDSQVTKGWTKDTLTNSNNYKISRPSKEKNTLVGIVGDAKLMNVMKIQDRFIDELTTLKGGFNFDYMVKTVVPNMIESCKEYGVAKKVKDQDTYRINGGVIFAHKDKLYEISSDGCVIEIDGYTADGSGFELALGYLNQNDDKSKRKAIIKAVKSACKTDLYVGYPIIVMNTKDEDVIIVEE